MELLIQVVDQINATDPVLNALRPKRGDVIVAVADGWPWSVIERANPNWRILRVDGLSATDAQILTTEGIQQAPDIGETQPIRQRRSFRIDIASLEASAPIRSALRDATRAAAIIEIPVADVLAARTPVAAVRA